MENNDEDIDNQMLDDDDYQDDDVIDIDEQI